MSEIVVFDTSILVDQLRTNRHLDQMLRIRGAVRNSAVVLAELLRGAITREERGFLAELAGNHPILTPNRSHWLESGQILARIRADKGFEPSKLRDLHFDVMIALTVRAHGARLITSNCADFELIRRYRSFALEVW